MNTRKSLAKSNTATSVYGRTLSIFHIFSRNKNSLRNHYNFPNVARNLDQDYVKYTFILK